MVHVAINGFGRIGRSFLRAYLSDDHAQKSMKISVINIGPAKKEWVAHLFKYDSFMGNLPDEITYQDGFLKIGKHQIPIVAELDPKNIGWDSYNIDWVVDATGKFTQREHAQKHLDAGAKKVLITALAQNPDVTIVLGVNDMVYDASAHKIVSMASCTANALYPIVKVLHDAFDLKSIIMNTMHSYTNRQVLMDIESVNLRRSRGAAVNIIPTTLCAPERMKEVYPEFKGQIFGQSTRVPVGKVSLLDVAFTTEASLATKDVNDALIKACKGNMKGVLNTSTEPLVSIDYTNNPYSVTIDESLTTVAGSMGKVFGWYDNEAGYSHRLKDFFVKFG